VQGQSSTSDDITVIIQPLARRRSWGSNHVPPSAPLLRREDERNKLAIHRVPRAARLQVELSRQ
jgi:hypothetical protein